MNKIKMSKIITAQLRRYVIASLFVSLFFDTTNLAYCGQTPTRILNTNAINGRIIRNPDLAAYDDQTRVTLKAEPDNGYHFAQWSGDLENYSDRDIIDKIKERYFSTPDDRARFLSFVQDLSFDEVFDNFDADSLMETLLELGFIKNGINDKETLTQRLLDKGIDVYALKLRPDGILSAINDIREEGTIFREPDHAKKVEKEEFKWILDDLAYTYSINLRKDLVENGYIDNFGEIQSRFLAVSDPADLDIHVFTTRKRDVYNIISNALSAVPPRVHISDFLELAKDVYLLRPDNLWNHLKAKGYINDDGDVLPAFYSLPGEFRSGDIDWRYRNWQRKDTDIYYVLNGWIDMLTMANTVKTSLKELFEEDREGFLNRLSAERFLDLLGAYSDDEALSNAPIRAHAFTAYEGEYILNTASVLFYPSQWNQFPVWQHNSWYDGNIGDDSLSVVADQLAGMPEGDRVLYIQFFAFYEYHWERKEYISPMDELEDAYGSVILNPETGKPYLFPSLNRWTSVCVGRMESLMDELNPLLSEKGTIIDKIDVDYELWDTMYYEFIKFYKKSDGTYDFSPLLQDPRTGDLLSEIGLTENDLITMNQWSLYDARRVKWDNYMLQKRASAWSDVFGVSLRYYPGAVTTNWGDVLRAQTVPNAGNYASYASMWGLGSHMAGSAPSSSFYGGAGLTITPRGFIKTDPETPSWAGVRDPYYVSFDADMHNTLFNTFLCNLEHANSMSSATSLLTRHWVTFKHFQNGVIGPDALYVGDDFIEHILSDIKDEISSRFGWIGTGNPFDADGDGTITPGDIDRIDNIKNLSKSEREATAGRILSGLHVGLSSGDAGYIQAFDANRDGLINIYDYNAVHHSLYTCSSNNERRAEYGIDMGDAMAELWYMASRNADDLQFWNFSNWRGVLLTGPDDYAFALDTLGEINEMFRGGSPCAHGYAFLNGNRISAGPVLVDYAADIAWWAVECGGENIYRVIIDLEKVNGNDRVNAVINDGTNGAPVEIRAGQDVLTIPEGVIKHPSKEVSKHGFWVVQDKHAGKILNEDMDSVLEAISVDVSHDTIDLTMDRDRTVTARFAKNIYSLNVIGGSGSGEYEHDSIVRITADSPQGGQHFVRWEGDISGVADINSAVTTITVTQDAEIEAVYAVNSYTLTVTNGAGSGTYEYGAVVPIRANTAPAGMIFVRWEGDTENIADVNYISTTITIYGDAIINAVYENGYNTPPVIYDIPTDRIHADENELIEFDFMVRDDDQGDIITVTSLNMPEGALLEPSYGNRYHFRWQTDYNDVGLYKIVIKAEDQRGASDIHDVEIVVNNVNRPPVLGPIGDKIVKEGEQLTFQVTAEDLDEQDVLKYLISALPKGASFNNRVFEWTPAYDQQGEYEIELLVKDYDSEDSETITITVIDQNIPAESPPASVEEPSYSSTSDSSNYTAPVYAGTIILADSNTTNKNKNTSTASSASSKASTNKYGSTYVPQKTYISSQPSGSTDYYYPRSQSNSGSQGVIIYCNRSGNNAAPSAPQPAKEPRRQIQARPAMRAASAENTPVAMVNNLNNNNMSMALNPPIQLTAECYSQRSWWNRFREYWLRLRINFIRAAINISHRIYGNS